MSEQDLNNETYEIPSNDVNSSSGEGRLVTGSSLAETINAAGGVDPTRFWVVIMIGLFICIATVVMAGGAYLIEQVKQKDVEITGLKKDLKECPQKTLEDFKKQSETIDQLRSEVLQERGSIEEMKRKKLEDVKTLEKINNKLENLTP